MKQTIETTIDAVTVYQDRARVMRVGSAEISTETSQLVIDQLPLTLDVDSVRVNGIGTAGVRILAVDVKREHFRETPAERVRELQEQIQATQDEIRTVDDEKAALQTQMTYLDGLRGETEQFARGLALGRSDVSAQIELLTFVQERDGEIRKAQRYLDATRRDLSKTLQHQQAQLKELQSKKATQRYQAVVDVEVVKDGSFSAELTYVVRRCGWKPLYDVRLNETKVDQTVELTMLAQVTQRSGEDWNAVALTLSTARPALNQRKPELKPWYVDEYKPRPVKRLMKQATRSAPESVARAMPAAPMAMSAQAEPVEEAEIVTAEVEQVGMSVTFRVQGESDVPGNGTPRKTTLGFYELEPKVDYVAVPKHTDSVFRRATVKNTTPTTLLPGAINLFVGGEFIGRNHLQLTAPEDEIELMLGVEDRVTVSRELLRRNVDKKLLRDRRTVRYGYRTELHNLLPFDVNITLEDQIPVSRHEGIKVTMHNTRPSPTETSDLNLLKWVVLLKPSAKATVDFEYSVEHPREMRVSGLID